MRETFYDNGGNTVRGGRFVRGILACLLPSDDNIFKYPVMEVAEYTGLPYDHPQQLEKIRQRIADAPQPTEQ